MFSDFATAVRLLTIVPLGTREGARPARFFSSVGWLYAVVALGIASAAAGLGRADGLAALLVGIVVVVAWATLSGFLHWDGLADSADGLGVRGDRERRLMVMRESTIGAFGVAAIVFVALLQVISIAVIVESRSWWALGAAPVLGRWGAGIALSVRPCARPDGLATRCASRLTGVDMAIMTLPVFVLFAVPQSGRSVLLVATLAGMCVALLAPSPFARRLGGITGDVLGATVVLTETFVLAMAALAAGPL